MNYKITLTKENFSIEGDLFTSQENNVLVASTFFQGEGLEKIREAYVGKKLQNFFDSCMEESFVVFVRDGGNLYAISDKFGTQQVFYTTQENKVIFSNNLSELITEKHKYSTRSWYELLVLFTVAPPRTIYEGVFSLPMASILQFNGTENKSSTRYWNVEKFFKDKEKNYERHINLLKEKFLESLSSKAKNNVGVSLSGGIDSSAILGMLKKIIGKAPYSVTYGGHGKKTPDLDSSRLTIKEMDSDNKEIYPSFSALKKLPEYMKSLDQPMIADLVFPNMMIYEEFQAKDISSIGFGFGAEMLLGNLKISRIYTRLKYFELFVPREILNFVYKLTSKILKLSKNQEDFLLSNSWERRFLLARGPLFTRESHLYKSLPGDFLEVLEDDLKEKIVSQNIDQMDRFVMMYLFSWVNYLQLRDFNLMGRLFGVSAVSPFDTPIVAEQLFKTPNSFRKKNKWSKQVLRDVSKPFVSERLYMREVRSLIVPYTTFFNGTEDLFFEYLKKSELVSSLIEMDSFIKEYKSLPEPGLTLMRLIGIAVWDDVKMNREVSLESFNNACVFGEKKETQ